MLTGLFHRTRPTVWPNGFWHGVAVTLAIVVGLFCFVRASNAYCTRHFGLISPYSRCRMETGLTFMRGYEDFSADLQTWIGKQKSEGVISGASVYFRDMENGPWFGIRENDDFLPASLFKVPVMMVILKEGEKDPSLMTQELGAETLPDLSTDITDPNRTVVAGQRYTIDALLQRMIMYSDNQSMRLLSKRLAALGHNGDAAKRLYHELGLLPADDTQTVTVRGYASLFRILYNARYLTPEDSEKALELLAGSDFSDGIVAGLPSGTKVAHKFGIHNVPGERLLHDCGIVYHPLRPYLICIMTRGNDIGNSAATIAEISRRVYQQVNQNIVSSW